MPQVFEFSILPDMSAYVDIFTTCGWVYTCPAHTLANTPAHNCTHKLIHALAF